MMSGYIDDYVVSAAQQAGASGYLGKDLQPDEVIRSLRTFTGERRTTASRPSTNLMDRFHDGVQANAQRRPEASWLSSLTLREREVLAGIQQGRTNRDIAIRLSISVNTVNKHVRHLLEKLKVKNRAQ